MTAGNLQAVWGQSVHATALTPLVFQSHQTNAQQPQFTNEDLVTKGLFPFIMFMDNQQEGYTAARGRLANLYMILLKDLDNQTLLRLALRAMPTFLIPPEREISDLKFNYKTKEETIAVDLRPQRDRITLDGEVFHKKRGLVRTIDERHLFLAVGIETILELPQEKLKQLKIKENPEYHVLAHELGHAIYLGGLTNEQRADVNHCWQNVKPSSRLISIEKEEILKLEYFANYMSLWFGTFPGGYPDYRLTMTNNLCMSSFFRKLFRKNGPYKPDYISKQLP